MLRLASSQPYNLATSGLNGPVGRLYIPISSCCSIQPLRPHILDWLSISVPLLADVYSYLISKDIAYTTLIIHLIPPIYPNDGSGSQNNNSFILRKYTRTSISLPQSSSTLLQSANAPFHSQGTSNRLPPRDPLLRPLAQLPAPPRRSYLRGCSLAELDMRTVRQSR